MRKILLIALCAAISWMSTAQTTSSVRSDGTILKNGEPFFPFGTYNWLASPGDDQSTRLEDLQAQIDAGFNISHIVVQPQADREALFDLADANEIYLYVTEPNANNMPLTAPWIKGRKSLFAYEVADDADNGKHTVEELEQIVDEVEEIDPSRIKYLTLTGYSRERQNRAGEFAAICDVIAPQAYPITPLTDYYINDESRALIETYQFAELYADAATNQSPKRPMIWTTQAFAWTSSLGGWSNTHSNPRYPTVAESRNMFYAGIAAGAKGIDIYSYSRELRDEQTDLWNEILAIRDDVLSIENALMNGAYTRVYTQDEELAISYWEHENEMYIVMLNTSYSNTKNVTLSIPENFDGALTALDERFSNTMSLENQELSGALAPTDVQVYKIAGRTFSDVTFRVQLDAGDAGPAYLVGGGEPLEWEFTETSQMSLVEGSTDTYEITLSLEVGVEYGYRFTKGADWDLDEKDLIVAGGCDQIWDDSRSIIGPASHTVLSTIAWGSCPQLFEVEFKVDMGSMDDSNGVYLFGDWYTDDNGNPIGIEMLAESEGSKVYTTTASFSEGEELTFVYGAAADGSINEGVPFSCETDDKRTFVVEASDAEVGYHWGTCLDYMLERKEVEVQFLVDVTGTDYEGAEYMYITGNHNNWEFEQMTPYYGSTTHFLYSTYILAGNYGQYFILGSADWNNQEPDHTSCAPWKTNDRYYEIELSDNMLAFEWGTCEEASLPTGVQVTFQVTLPEGEPGPAYLLGATPLTSTFDTRSEMALVAETSNTYEITRFLEPETDVSYQFAKGNGLEHQEVNEEAGCGEYRSLSVGDEDSVLDVVSWEECAASQEPEEPEESEESEEPEEPVDPVLSVEKEELSIFPNPASGEIHITGMPSLQMVTAYSTIGSKYTLEVQQGIVDIRGLRSGMYVFEVGREKFKILVQ